MRRRIEVERAVTVKPFEVVPAPPNRTDGTSSASGSALAKATVTPPGGAAEVSVTELVALEVPPIMVGGVREIVDSTPFCRRTEAVRVVPAKEAESVTGSEDPAAGAVMGKEAVVEPAATTTETGTEREDESLLPSRTVTPPAGAELFKVTDRCC